MTSHSRLLASGAFALAVIAALAPGTAMAAFPGDNGVIAFSGRLDEGEGIFTIRPDGSALQQVTDDPLGFDDEPSWSADGRRLVFARSIPGSEGDDYSIFIIDASGEDRAHVVDIDNSLVSPAPSFSPSGRRISYAVVRPHTPRPPVQGSIRTIRPDGTRQRRLLKGFFEEPQYSPSGKRIAFAGRPERKERSGIWTMRRDGSRLRLLTNPKRGLSDTAPDYSPDGRHIAFLRCEPRFCNGIRVMRADGSHERSVPDTFDARSLAYAPAGGRIAVSLLTGLPGYAQFCSDIYTTSPRGSNSENVTNQCDPYGFGGAAGSPSWQPVR